MKIKKCLVHRDGKHIFMDVKLTIHKLCEGKTGIEVDKIKFYKKCVCGLFDDRKKVK